MQQRRVAEQQLFQQAGQHCRAASAVIIKMRIRTLAGEQWTVSRELRRRIKNRFDADGIEWPVPQLSVFMGAGGKPFAVDARHSETSPTGAAGNVQQRPASSTRNVDVRAVRLGVCPPPSSPTPSPSRPSRREWLLRAASVGPPRRPG